MPPTAHAESVPPFWTVAPEPLPSTAAADATGGLSDAEAAALLAHHGPNELRATPSLPAGRILINQLESAIVWLLLAAAVLSLVIGELLEGAAIGVAVALTVALGFFSELRATRSMEALRELGAVRARVRRGGVERLVPASQLVPGDLVIIEAGDRVTADLRIANGSKLQADESVLTGESVPVTKVPGPAAAPGDRRSALYKGTAVVRGAGEAVVVATGMDTELGRIASLVAEVPDEKTPLELQLATMGRTLLWLCLAIAAVTAAAGIAGGRSVFLMIETSVALAVAAIPEGLPIVATIALARGMWRLAGRHALVKTLSAVETLGETGVIVVDKTGTLTANQLSVVEVVAGDARAEGFEGAPRAALEIAVLCNNASLEGDEATGDPLEIALLRAAAAAGLDREHARARWPEVSEEAFDPTVKMMATVHRDDGGVRVAAKGAPEAILAVSTASAEERERALARSEEMARRGLRVLALAGKRARSADVEVYADLELVALVAFADPARPEVIEPIARCRDAGIRVIMATGDQAATAASVAEAVGLDDDIHARVTPEQKLDIVRAHQRAGAVVAMTGDGVNDAPALHQADIGIAMGRRGTAVAREAADMVLTDDSFASIVAAVEQGRAIFENIRRFVIYLLSCNLSEVLVVTIAVFFGAPLPLLPLQILFLNLVTDVFPALALGFGKGDAKAMTRPPRPAGEPIVSRAHWLEIGAYASLITAAVLGAMTIAIRDGVSVEVATSISFLTLGFAQLWHALAVGRTLRNPWVWGALVLCGALLVLAAEWSPLADVLGVASLGGREWTIAVAMSLAPAIAVFFGLAVRKVLS